MLGVLGKKMREGEGEGEEEEEEGEEEEEEGEGEEEEEGEGKMMLKIDEITHFLRIVKSQNTNRICVWNSKHLCNLEIFFFVSRERSE